jgi:hypothetical protein
LTESLGLRNDGMETGTTYNGNAAHAVQHDLDTPALQADLSVCHVCTVPWLRQTPTASYRNAQGA